jgi:ABC-2 type transport system ATP-binding protein
VTGLVKTFGRARALDGLDLTVHTGEVHGFLGPNGAGKSTTLRILLGLLRADSGSALLFGGDPWRDTAALHRRLAYVPGDVTLWPGLTGGEVIDLLGRLRGGIDAKRRTSLIERFDLDPAKKCRAYSKGNRQKVALVAALASDAELLILDEPTSGLDPQSRIALWDIVREVHRDGQTVVLTTHFMEEADRLCERLAIMDHGVILALDTPAALKRTVGGDTIVRVVAEGDGEVLADALRGLEGVTDTRVMDGTVQLTATGAEGLLPRVLARAEAGGARVRDLSIDVPTLETVFINLTGKDLRE